MRIIIAALVLLAAALPLRAEEVIHEFAQTIEMTGEDRLIVTETIEVLAEGREIRRGIFRDVPTAFEDDDGRLRQVGFDVLGVTRDGEPEPYSEERSRRGVRIRIGQEDVFLVPGRHTYTITYETTRQIRRFETHDELYWNVTGNEWVFPIERASARVILPDGVRAGRTTAYTGPFGAQGTDWRETTEDGGRVLHFVTTEPLAPGEGLTIVVELPKGAIAEPTATEELGYAVRDWSTEIVGGAGLAVLLAYYLWAWMLVGRDPRGGTVIPLFEPPKGISPALADYVHYQGFSGSGWTALSAAVVSLAVKGLLTLEDLDGKVRLDRTTKPVKDGLPKGEVALLDWLEERGGSAAIDEKNGEAIQGLGRRFRSAIERENRNRFFVTNGRFAAIGVGVTVVAMAALVFLGGFVPEHLFLFVPMIVMSVFVSAAAMSVRHAFRPGANAAARVGAVLAVGAAGFALLVSGTIAFVFLSEFGGDIVLPLFFAVFVGINVLFFNLLRAPTALGRRTMDDIEGLRLYLSVAEQERMNMAGAPAVTPSRFETLLPYAIALGVEKPWSEALKGWLSSAAATGSDRAWQPHWYHGRSAFSGDLAGALGGLSSSFQSSLPAPKSSSSGFSSGGSSGGGGGGGGGGGW